VVLLLLAEGARMKRRTLRLLRSTIDVQMRSGLGLTTRSNLFQVQMLSVAPGLCSSQVKQTEPRQAR
jgi:hypothetical protein